MANDREVLKVVWEGKIPVKFSEFIVKYKIVSKCNVFNIFTAVDDDEGDQDSFYLMLPRVSYLPLVTDKVIRSMLDMFPNWLKAFVSLQVKKHFQRHVEKEDEVWFSFNDTPLKWHYPIGLLFDLLVTDDILPWVITVKFSKYPEEVLFKCPNK